MTDKHAPTLRWQLIRDATVFQLKLALDALRDILLSPFSIIAAVVDLMMSETHEQSLFYRLLRAGRSSERWIDLFGAADHGNINPPQTTAQDQAPTQSQSMDQWMRQAERLLKEQYERGGITANAKDAVDHLLDRLRTNAGLRATPSQPGTNHVAPADGQAGEKGQAQVDRQE